MKGRPLLLVGSALSPNAASFHSGLVQFRRYDELVNFDRIVQVEEEEVQLLMSFFRTTSVSSMNIAALAIASRIDC